MKRILLADAGSTKVEWALISQAGEIENTIVVSGLNALLAEQDEEKRAFISVAQNFQGDQRIEEIHYYGAGCATQSICSKMETALSDVWSDAECHVHSDLVGAARSLFGNRKGIACILGTGSNSCLYDGSGIISQIPSLGYILGDEGSGAALGRRLIGDAFKEQLPQNVKEAFLEEFHLTLEEILNRVYKSPSPNSFLASFVPFLKKNLWNPYVYSLVLRELTRFVRRNVAMYPGAHSLEVSFTGSIAFHFDRILREAASSLGYCVSTVTESPMPGLINYHKSNDK